MQRLRSFLFTVSFCLSAIVAALPVQAQTSGQQWPQRPVRFIIPLGPGSGVDITARLVADKLSAKWGQPVVVENRPGGDAFLAITAVLSAHDDHVLLFAPASTFSAHTLLHDKLPYDPKELVPIARVTNTLIALGVPSDLNVSSVKELAAKIKSEPGKLNYASVTGANDLLFAAWLKTEKLDMAKVPYKDTVQAINDLAEGRIHAFVGAYAIFLPMHYIGMLGVPRRYYALGETAFIPPSVHYANMGITIAAGIVFAAQGLFFYNMIVSLFRGPKADPNRLPEALEAARRALVASAPLDAIAPSASWWRFSVDAYNGP